MQCIKAKKIFNRRAAALVDKHPFLRNEQNTCPPTGMLQVGIELLNGIAIRMSASEIILNIKC
jgi:hypothetical protein